MAEFHLKIMEGRASRPSRPSKARQDLVKPSASSPSRSDTCPTSAYFFPSLTGAMQRMFPHSDARNGFRPLTCSS